jgi:hypothetical protein
MILNSPMNNQEIIPMNDKKPVPTHVPLPFVMGVINEMTTNIALYRVALADAIRRPLGIIPASAEGLVTDAEIDAAEKRTRARD